MAYIKLLKDDISVGTHVHKAGDIVNVPDRRAESMVRYHEGIPVEGPEDTPSPPRIETATVAHKTAERATAPRQR